MLVRIISALVGVPLLLLIVIKGGFLLKASLLIVTIIAIDEFFNAFEHKGIAPSKTIGILSTILLAAITYEGTNVELILFWFFISTLFILVYNLVNQKMNILSSGITGLGIYYISFFMFHVGFIANSIHPKLIWLVFITAWGTDTGAYFTGSFMGKTKLCPTISPKKTVEGAIGGIIGSVVGCLLFAFLFAPQFIMHSIILGVLGSIFGQLGDLTASIFKRHTGIKDYGKIMPGHGGILDRFDSILFTAPIVYYYIVFFIR